MANGKSKISDFGQNFEGMPYFAQKYLPKSVSKKLVKML